MPGLWTKPENEHILVQYTYVNRPGPVLCRTVLLYTYSVIKIFETASCSICSSKMVPENV